LSVKLFGQYFVCPPLDLIAAVTCSSMLSNFCTSTAEVIDITSIFGEYNLENNHYWLSSIMTKALFYACMLIIQLFNVFPPSTWWLNDDYSFMCGII